MKLEDYKKGCMSIERFEQFLQSVSGNGFPAIIGFGFTYDQIAIITVVINKNMKEALKEEDYKLVKKLILFQERVCSRRFLRYQSKYIGNV